ncbi:MAG: hypothetical protein CVU56_01885 [Deltaproteobacteria bacterium HGW-Deltaproteobacteria-14]|jgi:hypothetical protein|nr:MAG: hypothetical protein CVU56_01885 [Deltaproteobacteria bacterium HGW-Deltaproteobacteria-14]
MKKDEIEQQPLNLPGGGKALIEWCRPLWMSAPDARRPLRLEVTATVAIPDAIGMPEGPELTTLDNLEFKLGKALPGGAEHVMTVTGGGERTWVYYLKAAVGLLKKQDPREALAPALAKLAASTELPVRVEWADDPGWTRLLGIFAAHDPAQWKEDRALFVHMLKASDAIRSRRVVAHRAFFPDREGCREFLRDVRKLKFKADGGPKETSTGEFVGLVERLEPTIETWHLHPVVLSVKEIVLEHGGRYHGWETELIPSLVPPPLTGPRPQ